MVKWDWKNDHKGSINDQRVYFIKYRERERTLTYSAQQVCKHQWQTSCLGGVPLPSRHHQQRERPLNQLWQDWLLQTLLPVEKRCRFCFERLAKDTLKWWNWRCRVEYCCFCSGQCWVGRGREEKSQKEDGRRRGNRGTFIQAVPVTRIMRRWGDFPRHLSLHGRWTPR